MSYILPYTAYLNPEANFSVVKVKCSPEHSIFHTVSIFKLLIKIKVQFLSYLSNKSTAYSHMWLYLLYWTAQVSAVLGLCQKSSFTSLHILQGLYLIEDMV